LTSRKLLRNKGSNRTGALLGAPVFLFNSGCHLSRFNESKQYSQTAYILLPAEFLTIVFLLIHRFTAIVCVARFLRQTKDNRLRAPDFF
jgi:hypothetical protein